MTNMYLISRKKKKGKFTLGTKTMHSVSVVAKKTKFAMIA